MFLQRFLDAQKREYENALSEIKSGRKRSHWMWYIFPQIKGLGHSETSRFYAIQNRQQAEEYLQNPVLGKRLTEISNALLDLDTDDAHSIFWKSRRPKIKIFDDFVFFSSRNKSGL